MSQATRPFDQPLEVESDLAEIWRGLSQTPKRLPCKLFYDAHGSRLFERITLLPEYYPTRTETEILRAQGAELAACIGPEAVVVELGSGASLKTRLLLGALERPRVYVPIDISREMLMSSANALATSHAGLDVRPLCADYLQELNLPLTPAERRGPICAFFPGSTIGNFEPEEAVTFLRRLRRIGAHVRLVIGVDLPKERAVLEAAYDDRDGVTARFNLNALTVLNREYGAKFRLGDFVHRAVWNEKARRVEMHLISQREHRVLIGGRSFGFAAHEAIVTEHCYKHSLEDFRELAASAGYEVARAWLDPERKFSLQLLEPA